MVVALASKKDGNIFARHLEKIAENSDHNINP
jgi:hypothetical protein